MPQTKKPFKRYNILDRCFSNTGRNFTFEDLKQGVNDWMMEMDPKSIGISTRQLREDIAFMKSSDGREAPIVTVRGIGKRPFYRYEDSTFSISRRPINQAQIEELKMLFVILPENLTGFLVKFNVVNLDQVMRGKRRKFSAEYKAKIAEDISFDADEYFEPVVGVSRPLIDVTKRLF